MVTLPSSSRYQFSAGVCESELDNAAFNGRLFLPKTLAELRAIVTHSENFSANLLGYEAAYDGLLQGTYIWENAATDADNGTTRIRPSDFTSAGVWYKLT